MKTKEDGKKLFMTNENGNKIVKTKKVRDSNQRCMIIILQWSLQQTLVHLVDVPPPQLLDEAVPNATVLPIDHYFFDHK